MFTRMWALPLAASCILITSSVANTQDVYGAIGEKYKALGGPGGPLGRPLTSEANAPHGGRFNNFQNGSIYWHPSIGAFAVWGAIGGKWNDYRHAEFGYPLTDETKAADGIGRFNHFRAVHISGKPESSIYWTPETGARVIYGAIRHKWAQLGWERWAYPITDEMKTPDGVGRYNHFRAVHLPGKPEASIYWHPRYGALEIYGEIRKKWAAMGWERSSLGYPISREYQEYEGSPIRRQAFERGSLWWSPGTGVTLTPPIATPAPPPPPGQPPPAPQPPPPGLPPPFQPPGQVRYCTDDCQTCRRDGLRCELNNNCSFQNYRNPYACFQ